MVVLVGFRVWSSRIACLATMAAAVVITQRVVIVPFGIWRIAVLGPPLVLLVHAVISFADGVGRYRIIAMPTVAQPVPRARPLPSLPQVFKVFPVNVLLQIQPAVLIKIVLSSEAATAKVMSRNGHDQPSRMPTGMGGAEPLNPSGEHVELSM